jgi:hypothetical protein
MDGPFVRPRSSPGDHEQYVVHVSSNASGSSIGLLRDLSPSPHLVGDEIILAIAWY